MIIWNCHFNAFFIDLFFVWFLFHVFCYLIWFFFFNDRFCSSYFSFFSVFVSVSFVFLGILELTEGGSFFVAAISVLEVLLVAVIKPSAAFTIVSLRPCIVAGNPLLIILLIRSVPYAKKVKTFNPKCKGLQQLLLS